MRGAGDGRWKAGGDLVQVKNENTNETYQATLIGKRIAVVGGTLSEADEKLLREAR